MQIPHRSGRWFNSLDGPKSEPVAIVNERLAKRLWPGRDPIGQSLRYGLKSAAPYRKVGGIAGDVKQRDLAGEAGYDYFVPYRQQPNLNEFLVAKTALSLPRTR
jgi:hypothetical protein